MNKKLSIILLLLPFLLFTSFVFGADLFRAQTGDFATYAVHLTASGLDVATSTTITNSYLTVPTYVVASHFTATTTTDTSQFYGLLSVTGNASFGTIIAGTWNGTPISDTYISSATTWNNKQATISVTSPVILTGATIALDSNYKFTAANGSTTLPTINVGTLTATTGTSFFNALNLGTALTVANGGTGAGTFIDGGVMIGNGVNGLQVTSAGLSGQVLVAGGATVDPTYQWFRYDFTPTTNFNTIMSATSSSIWYTGSSGVYASSTSYLASTTITWLNAGSITATGTLMIAGKVGIATSTPAAQLGITGDVYHGSAATTTIYLKSTLAKTAGCIEFNSPTTTQTYRYYMSSTGLKLEVGTCK